MGTGGGGGTGCFVGIAIASLVVDFLQTNTAYHHHFDRRFHVVKLKILALQSFGFTPGMNSLIFQFFSGPPRPVRYLISPHFSFILGFPYTFAAHRIAFSLLASRQTFRLLVFQFGFFGPLGPSSSCPMKK
jgi:hypothetical protein